ncbi:MAG: substrate-binding domain-containing protein, partial [Pseudomonadota bacterium]
MDGNAPPAFFTTKELADLLRVKERRVYDLAAAGEVPCSRVTGKLLFPRAAVEAWLAASLDGPRPPSPRPMVMLGSHDPLLEWALRQSGAAMPSFFDGSLDGLARFAAREGVAAALHLFDAASGEWNRPAMAAAGAGDGAVLLAFCRRRRGLLLPAGSAIDGIGLADVAHRPFARRQEGSGSETLLAHL